MLPNLLINFGSLSNKVLVPVSRLVRPNLGIIIAIIQIQVWLHLRLFMVEGVDLL
ncbi:hypothetical protein MTR67_039214 [Solanum verrucosum]|uniref:Uncharacterized protein n=1 Tax=Solanum verrucosum TaxID=315347 RepID=A0AAF0ZQZ1_SOLVR|nr:hypothetical protein MTR67_039214 [Solanum verrucosum]